jgi:hypothetical protein
MMIRYALTLVFLIGILHFPFLTAQIQLGSTIEDMDSIARIGTNVDLSANGQRLLAGAPNASTVHWLGGKVQVYDLLDGEWVQVGQDIFGTQESANFGTHLAMSADGSRFVVGVQYVGGPVFSGSMQVYEWQENQWDTLGQVIYGEGESNYAGFSAQMSADGNRIAGFVTDLDEDEDEVKVIKVYDYQDGTWTLVGDPIFPSPSYQPFNYELAMSRDGQTLAASQEYNSTFEQMVVYRFMDGAWQPLGSPIISSEPVDLFAWSISISDDGNRIVVGAPKSNANVADSGNVTTYDFVDGAWVQVGTNITGDELWDQTGYSVSLSGDGTRLIVGDHYYDEPEFNAGRVRVFQWVEEDWVMIGAPIIGEDRADFFGQEVAMSRDGSTVAIGAPQGGGNYDTPGQVKVFGEYPWAVVSNTVEPARQLRVYPNPVTDWLFLDHALGADWQIWDALGRRVQAGILGQGQIEVRNLVPGLYYLRVQMGANIHQVSFIKQ